MDKKNLKPLSTPETRKAREEILESAALHRFLSILSDTSASSAVKSFGLPNPAT